MLAPWKKSCDKPRQHIRKQKHCFTNKGSSSQSFGFSCSHVWMWELDYKESWALRNWCFWTMVLEKTLDSPLDCMEIQPVHPKGNQSWSHLKDWCWNSNTSATWLEEIRRADSFEQTLMLGKIEDGRWRDDRGWDGWMASPTRWTWVRVSSRNWWWTGKPGVLQSMGLQSWARLSNWTELNWTIFHVVARVILLKSTSSW